MDTPWGRAVSKLPPFERILRSSSSQRRAAVCSSGPLVAGARKAFTQMGSLCRDELPEPSELQAPHGTWILYRIGGKGLVTYLPGPQKYVKQWP